MKTKKTKKKQILDYLNEIDELAAIRTVCAIGSLIVQFCILSHYIH